MYDKRVDEAVVAGIQIVSISLANDQREGQDYADAARSTVAEVSSVRQMVAIYDECTALIERAEAEEAPGEGQDGWSETEGNYVGKGVHFAAEIAGGVRHTRDPAVQAIQENRDPDTLRRDFEMPVGTKFPGRSRTGV